MVKGEVKYEDDVIAENIQSAERASGIEPVAFRRSKSRTLTKTNGPEGIYN
jgi:hypothetical protein